MAGTSRPFQPSSRYSYAQPSRVGALGLCLYATEAHIAMLPGMPGYSLGCMLRMMRLTGPFWPTHGRIDTSHVGKTCVA